MIPAGAPGAMIYSGATGAPVLTPAPMPQIALPDKTETTKGEGEAPPAEAPPAEAPPAEAPPAEAPPAEAPPAKDIGRADIDGPDLEIYNVGNESLANVNSLQYEGIANKVGGPDSDIYNIGLDTPLNVQSPTGPSTLPSANTSSAGPLDKQLVQKSEAPPAENWREQITSPFKKAIGNTGKSDIAKVPLTLPPNMPAQPSRIQNARKPAAEVPRNPWGDLSVSQPAQRPIEAPPAKSIDSTLEKGIGEVPLNTGNEPLALPAEPGKIENVLKPAAEAPRNPLPSTVAEAPPAEAPPAEAPPAEAPPAEAPPAKSIDSTLEKGIGEVPLNTGNEPYTPPAEPGKIENVLKPAAEVPRNPLPAGVSTDDSAGESGGGDARGSDGGGGGDSIWGELGAAAITGALGLIGQHQADKAADKATEAQMQIYREQQERYNRLYGPIEENLANYYNTVTPKSATAQHLQQYQAEYQKQMKRFTETAAQRGVSETAQMAMKQQAELGSAAARAQIRYDTPQALRQSQQGFLALGAGLDTAAATGLSNMYGQQAQQAREAQTAGWNMFGNALGSALSTYAQRPKTSASQGTLLTG
jgi:hypothetical protein